MTEALLRHSFSALAARRDRVGGVAVFSRYTLAPVYSGLPVVLIHARIEELKAAATAA